MITNYKQTKEEALCMYNAFLEITSEVGFEDTETSMIALKNQADNIKKDRFLLMIAGEAKSGKSTFINAYLGQEVLPMDVKQCTSSIVEIRYGKEFTLTATYANDEKIKLISEPEIKKFLSENAALDDNYRDIPVPTINHELLVKYKSNIPEHVIKDMLSNVKEENIYRLPEKQYEQKIREYIKSKKDKWKEIVVKIEIAYPFEDESLRGVEIIDSPGVNAQGRVGDVTNNYIEDANAIMFLKPITGAALEATSFKKFLETKSADRNKDALFLILTRAANETSENLEKIHKEALKLFQGIKEEQIVCVDSKVEMFINQIKDLSVEEIASLIIELDNKKQLESFIELPWYKSAMNKAKYMEALKTISRFIMIDQALNQFGRKSHYLALSGFLGRILKVYTKIQGNLEDRVNAYELKAKDPSVLAEKIAEVKKKLSEINAKMRNTTDEITQKYIGDDGIVCTHANKVIEELKKDIEGIHGNDINELEKISFRRIDKFKEFQKELEKNIVAECNAALVMLSNQSEIRFTSLEPDFSKEIFEDIKNETEKEATEEERFYTGVTFKKTHSRSVYSQDKHFKIIKGSIIERLEAIKRQAINNLIDFAIETVEVYINELKNNAQTKKDELDKINEEKRTAEQIRDEIKRLGSIIRQINAKTQIVKETKGGIDSYVQ